MGLKKINEIEWKKIVADMLIISAGCVSWSFAAIAVMIPNGLSGGGLTGVARIVQQFVPIDFSILYYVGAMLVLLICWLLLGTQEAKKIVLLSILYPAFLMVFEHVQPTLLENKDMTLAAIFFGILNGIGSGLVFSRGYSSGGSDTIAKIIKVKLLPHVALSQLLLCVDGAIILCSAFVFGKNVALYALVSSIIASKVTEMVMYGFDPKLVQLEIISEYNKEITDYILHEIKRGVSINVVEGAYTGELKNKLITICSPRESMLIKRFIARLDRNAFVAVLHIDTVWGSGKGFARIEEDN